MLEWKIFLSNIEEIHQWNLGFYLDYCICDIFSTTISYFDLICFIALRLTCRNRKIGKWKSLLHDKNEQYIKIKEFNYYYMLKLNISLCHSNIGN